MPNRDLTNMRNSYEKGFLLEKDCDKNPIFQFEKWFQQAIDDNLYEPNAMQIATARTAAAMLEMICIHH